MDKIKCPCEIRADMIGMAQTACGGEEMKMKMKMKMKILSVALIVAMCTTLFSGCSDEARESEAHDPPMFITVEKDYYWIVVYHRDTKVMYAVSDGCYNHGTFTLLVNADGSPMLWEG